MKSIQNFCTSRLRHGRVVLAAGLISTLFACRDAVAPAVHSDNDVAAPAQSRESRKIKDEYIVVFRSSVADVPSTVSGLARRHTLSPKNFYTNAFKGFAGHMTAEVAEELAQDPNVAYVEQNGVVSIQETQTNAVWGLDRVDQANLPLSGSYTYSTNGAGVNVYIIDTGVRTTHTQFQGRAVAAFTAVQDGNGPQGCHWHGTHVAGTVGGWLVGVAKGVTLHSVRVLDCTGNGSDASVLAGIDWVTANAVMPAVANMSLGGTLSQAVNDAVQRSIESGVTYVVAAGNNNGDACNMSPAAVPNALTVGATLDNDAQASFSNWGTCVDMYAPGYSVYSAWNSSDNSFGASSGTSMAAPHVTGAAAMFLQSNPSASPAQVAAALVSAATSGVLSNLGPGSPNRLVRVNATAAAPSPAPAPPPAPAPAPVTDSPPTADFTFKCQKGKCTFDGSNSRDDRGVASFVWNFGDGTTQATSIIATAAHTYASRAKYSVTLKVVDGYGQSSSKTRTVDSR